MQHRFGAVTIHTRFTRKFRGRQPVGPAGDGETQVVSIICLTSLIDHLEVRGVKFCLPLLPKIHCDAVSVEKDKYLTHAHSSKVPGHQIVPNIVVIINSDTLNNSCPPPNCSTLE